MPKMDRDGPISSHLGTPLPKLWHTHPISPKKLLNKKHRRNHQETIHISNSSGFHGFLDGFWLSHPLAPPRCVWVAAPPSAAPAAATAALAKSRRRRLWARRRGGSWWRPTSLGSAQKMMNLGDDDHNNNDDYNNIL